MSYFNEVKVIQNEGMSVANGDVADGYIAKFGNAPDFDTGDNSVSITDLANDALLGGGAMSYTYSTSADISLLSSSSTGDTQEIEIQGLDSNFDVVIQNATLNGQVDVSLGTSLLRVFRMKNIGSSDLVGVVYLRTAGSAQSGGVPSTANTVRAIINNGNNQTLMAVYTIPRNRVGYLTSFYFETAGVNRSANYQIDVFARPVSTVFQLKHRGALQDVGTSVRDKVYDVPLVFAEKTDIELRSKILTSAITGASVSAGFAITLVSTT